MVIYICGYIYIWLYNVSYQLFTLCSVQLHRFSHIPRYSDGQTNIHTGHTQLTYEKEPKKKTYVCVVKLIEQFSDCFGLTLLPIAIG